MFELTLDDFPDGLILRLQPTGSKFICNPPVMSTDEDYFAWGFNYEKVIRELQELGWELCCNPDYLDTKFTALRKGSLNLIIVNGKIEFEKCVQCTKLAKRFNLLNKQDRIDLFELVRNGYYDDLLDDGCD